MRSTHSIGGLWVAKSLADVGCCRPAWGFSRPGDVADEGMRPTLLIVPERHNGSERRRGNAGWVMRQSRS